MMMRRCSGRASMRACAQVSASPSMFSLSSPSRIIRPEITPRAPPGHIGGLVDDVAQIVEAARIGGFARGKPLLARLAALPLPRREAEDFDLDAAALQRAGEDIGAAGGDHDRPSAHRAGIVEQQRDHRVAEGRVALLLEGERLEPIGDDAREPRGIERPSSRSKSQARFCCASRRRCRRFARRLTATCKTESCLSRKLRSRSSSSASHKVSALTNSSYCRVKT